jgi:vancomycin resistance protein VanJ
MALAFGPMTDPRYVFRCSKGHKVAVDPARYWLFARCPKCKSPIDRFRLQRVGAWLRGAAPRSRLRIGRVVATPLDGAGWLLFIGLCLVALGYRIFGDRTWWGTALIYSGRWPWLFFPIVTAIPALAWRRRALLPVGLALLVVLGPIMGGTLSTAPFWRKHQPLRVLTYNVEGGSVVGYRAAELLADTHPDIAGFEECGQVMREALVLQQGWAVVDTTTVPGLCFLSRYPLRQPAVAMPASAFQVRGGSAPEVGRFVVVAPRGTVTVFVLHLETPRHGVEHLLSDPLNAPPLIEANNILRDAESRAVRRWVDSTSGARIVTGDFNLPIESIFWQQHWSSLQDAFGWAGNGWGYTKMNGWILARIDHVLVDSHLESVGAWVGKDYGSDHLPFVAEVQIKEGG